MRLFTVSVSFDQMVEVKDRFIDMNLKEKKENRQIEKQTVLKKVYDSKVPTWNIISTDAEFRELRTHVSVMYERSFCLGYKYYKSGDWE